MKLTVTAKALEWFKQEFSLKKGTGIKFYGKVYGSTQVHDNFSIGLSVDEPLNPLIQEEIEGLLFFIEKDDDWFFEDYNLIVDYNENLEEPEYQFSK